MEPGRLAAALVVVLAASCGSDHDPERARLCVLVSEARYAEAVAVLDGLGDAALDDVTRASAVVALLASAGYRPETLVNPPPWFAPANPEISQAVIASLAALDGAGRAAFRRARS